MPIDVLYGKGDRFIVILRRFLSEESPDFNFRTTSLSLNSDEAQRGQTQE